MYKLIILLATLPLYTFAQIQDDFSDGNLNQNPQWIGNTEKFQINPSEQLQLNDLQEGLSYLVTTNTIVDSIEWEFWIKLSFSPSGNNNCRIYLIADQENITTNPNGFYLQFGEAGSDDAIELFRYQDNEAFSICRTTDGSIASSFAFFVKTTRSLNNVWTIYTKSSVEEPYSIQASGIENTPINGGYFGMVCKYTSSNSKKFYFDDFYVDHIEYDLTPPEIDNITINSADSIHIYFSEAITEESALEQSNYQINPGNITPSTVEFSDSHPSITELKLPDDLLPGTYQITITNITDLNGNIMNDYSTEIIYDPPRQGNAFDVLITEIMADVNPEPTELPAYDYVELFNTQDHPINMSRWTIQNGSNLKIFPDQTFLPANSHLLITDDNSPLGDGDNTITFSSFPVNNEAIMILSDSNGAAIHFLEYNKQCYQDDQKSEGGWSMEMIDINNPCGGIWNWRASEHPSGGTPLNINSVIASNPDYSPPHIEAITVHNNKLEISLSESISPDCILDHESIHITPNPGSITDMELIAPSNQHLHIIYSDSFKINTKYTFMIDSCIWDCAGNLSSVLVFEFNTYQPKTYDIVISEIMPDINPEPNNLPSGEYFEVYNRTNFDIDLQDWYFSIGPRQMTVILPTIIKAKSHLIFTDQNDFNIENQAILENLSLPNDSESIILFSPDNQIICNVTYDQDWHEDPYKAEGGWSLEMIDTDNPCGKKDNFSSCQNPNGGTPGIENSVKDHNPDQSVPVACRVITPEEQHLVVCFDEDLFPGISYSKELFSVNGFSPDSTYLDQNTFNDIHLLWDQPFDSTTNYQLEINAGINDCTGNLSENQIIDFAIPHPIRKGDLIINEVLYNPNENEEDFIEIYNKGQKVYDLWELDLQLIDPFTSEVKNTNRLFRDRFLIFPEQYVAFSSYPVKVQNYYQSTSPENILESCKFPNLPNDGHEIRITNQEGVIIDRMRYDDEMHFVMLNSTKGISLERINPELKGMEISNWHSASETSGFATPAYQNSQHHNSQEISELFSLDPKVFSPDNDGYNDLLFIHFKIADNGYTGSFMVFDLSGNLIKILADNQLLSQSGVYNWDGTSENGERSKIGPYIIYAEFVHPSGNILKEKKVVVLAER